MYAGNDGKGGSARDRMENRPPSSSKSPEERCVGPR